MHGGRSTGPTHWTGNNEVAGEILLYGAYATVALVYVITNTFHCIFFDVLSEAGGGDENLSLTDVIVQPRIGDSMQAGVSSAAWFRLDVAGKFDESLADSSISSTEAVRPFTKSKCLG